MRILIIGGGGYVGSMLVHKLVAQKIDVLVLDLFIYGNPKRVFSNFYESRYLTVIKGDLRDRDLMENLISKTDHVIHLGMMYINKNLIIIIMRICVLTLNRKRYL